ncbi:SEL1-like repeat protein [Microbulbifer pacificus]|uniref:Beta-lactamase n=1 Tax=Microbulbifer pacificus TaxID=407164 RepID=A0AAU0MYM7_9GAMM|nr:hypothetical protein [Microbulbifer pacificus]WOX04934.1 hypothetical protein R5R33_14480 [Microbulbifer pacificus]
MRSILPIFIFLFGNVVFANGSDKEILQNLSLNEEMGRLKDICPSELYSKTDFVFKDRISYCRERKGDCLSKCEGGDPNFCFGLGNVLQEGGILELYPELLYAKACKEGLVIACTNRAAGLMRFEAESKQNCYSSTFKLTCSKDDAWGCAMYGLVLHEGKGFKKNDTLALEVLDSACKFDVESQACQYAQQLKSKIAESRNAVVEK